MSEDQKPNPLLNAFNLMTGKLHRREGAIQTKPTTIRIVGLFGLGSYTYIIQTYRVRDSGKDADGDYISFEQVSEDEPVRIFIPPKVAEVIARQREQLTGKSRSIASRRVAEDRAARGIKPGFMKKGKA